MILINPQFASDFLIIHLEDNSVKGTLFRYLFEQTVVAISKNVIKPSKFFISKQYLVMSIKIVLKVDFGKVVEVQLNLLSLFRSALHLQTANLCDVISRWTKKLVLTFLIFRKTFTKSLIFKVYIFVG